MTTPSPVVFLMDVDNTLLDNDRITADVMRFVDRAFGRERGDRYAAIIAEIEEETGSIDFLAALEQLRLEQPRDPSLFLLGSYLADYPFANRLYPASLDVLERFRRWGPVVILSDGDLAFQPRKIDRSGLREAVDGVLIYVHKDLELDDVEERFPADRYVLVDDQLRVLGAVKMQWERKVVTVFPKQGRHARDVKALASYPPADLSVPRVGDLLGYELTAILSAGRAAERPAPLPRRPI